MSQNLQEQNLVWFLDFLVVHSNDDSRETICIYNKQFLHK